MASNFTYFYRVSLPAGTPLTIGPLSDQSIKAVRCPSIVVCFSIFVFSPPPPRSIAVASRFTGFFLGFTWFSSSNIGLDYNLDLISSINEFECMTNEKPQSRRDDNQ